MTVPTAPLAPTPGAFLRLGAAGPVAIVLSFWPPIGGFLLLATLTTAAPWLREHAALGLLVYFILTVILVGFSFLPTFACAIYAGWTFGFAIGSGVALTALTVAALVAYARGRCRPQSRAQSRRGTSPLARRATRPPRLRFPSHRPGCLAPPHPAGLPVCDR